MRFSSEAELAMTKPALPPEVPASPIYQRRREELNPEVMEFGFTDTPAVRLRQFGFRARVLCSGVVGARQAEGEAAARSDHVFQPLVVLPFRQVLPCAFGVTTCGHAHCSVHGVDVERWVGEGEVEAVNPSRSLAVPAGALASWGWAQAHSW